MKKHDGMVFAPAFIIWYGYEILSVESVPIQRLAAFNGSNKIGLKDLKICDDGTLVQILCF
jgi:hypothetical protein